MRKGLLGLVVILAWAAACSDPTSPPPNPVPSSQLHFLIQAPTAPALLARSYSFWAKSGEDREVRFYYVGAAPGDSGDEFLRFKVPAQALLRRPDGTLFAPGDSILITVQVADSTKFILGFEPSGLVFSAADPAQLEIEYHNADHDFNQDGVVNAVDDSIEHRIGTWKREASDTLWTGTSSVKYEEYDEIDAKITSFTQYAVAW